MGTSVRAAVVSTVRRYHRQVHGDGGDQPLAWFRVHVPHPRLWRAPQDGTAAEVAAVVPVVLDQPVRHRLAEGLRMSGGVDALVTATAPAPRATSTVERSYAGMASLLRLSTLCLVGVPEEVADRMRWAATGCGLLASRLDGLPVGARVRTSAEDARNPLQVTTLPGWVVGTDAYGEPVVLYLPPGTTALLRGAAAEVVSLTIPPSGRVVGEDVILASTIAGWEAAWHPQLCRVVVDTVGDLDDGCLPDVVVDLTAGTVSSGGVVVEITPLPLRT